MTWDERVKAIADHGFTERQAGFLVTVMLHSGVCLGRHYSAFARIAHGQKVQDFFDRLVARGYATARRVRAQHGPAVPRSPQAAVRGHWRARQSASPAASA